MERQETAILIATIVLIVLVSLTISLFLIFQRRKNSLLLKQKEAEKRFERAIAETQIEIREETLRNISWELHDNIGQLLTLAKIQIAVAKDNPNHIEEVTETITKSLTELRSLSKLINPDAIKSLSLTDSLQLEIERFNRLQFIKATLTSNKALRILDSKAEVVIFRIFQEFFSNTIKHSKAHCLDVNINYDPDKITISAKDDGIGFNTKDHTIRKGIGIGNMQSRAKLINASIQLESEKNRGTTIILTYPYKESYVPL